MKNVKHIYLKIFQLFLSTSILFGLVAFPPGMKTNFSGYNAFSLLAKLQSFGPRVPNSAAHAKAVDFIHQQLRIYGWKVEIQSSVVNSHPCHNIFAYRYGSHPEIVLASHFDSRLVADRDFDSRLTIKPVPGANDGGSSTVVLLELARTLPPERSNKIGLLFFDLEDQGEIPAFEWILGSRQFVEVNTWQPDILILLDMIGGHDQTIQPPENSDACIYRLIQSQAIDLGYGSHFINPSRYGIIDDHVPFLDAGVPSVDLIDIIDTFWHTTSDDLENVNYQSLQRMGDTLLSLLLSTSLKSAY